MMQRPSKDTAWYNAVTLTERLASLRAVQHRDAEAQLNAELAERRLERWRSQNPFTTEEVFAQRLAVDGLTEDEFLYLLGEPPEAVSRRLRNAPAWLEEITEAYLRSIGPETDGVSASDDEARGGQRALGFLTLIEPLILGSRHRLQRGVRELARSYAQIPFDPQTIESIFLANLPALLASLMGRTLALELNVARIRGLLKGSTPEERFDSFIDRLRRPEIALEILREYPVLARQLVVHLNNWLNVSLEFLQRLCADWRDLRSAFSPQGDPGLLVRVEGGVGDSHRGGRSVLVAHFSTGFQVVYKPKSLAVETHFQELLSWLNERGEHAPFRTIQVMDRGSYGWTQFVHAASCDSAAGLERFYERQGGYLALLYALEATDFHFENLIAAGEHPVLIDLESLFHPRTEESGAAERVKLVDSSVGYSVLRVGLLPQRLWLNFREDGPDLSGLGGAPGQLTPQGIPYWEAAGTDRMRLERRRVAMPGGKNRPSLNGQDVDPLDHMEAITRGFRQVYQLLAKHRDELLAEDGPLARFADDEVRFIVRPTRVYSMLLQESFHPDLLRQALDRDRFLDRLWVGIEKRPHLSRVIPAERRDLQNGDIPMFTTKPNSHDIWSSDNVRLAEFLDQTGLELVRRRVGRLGEADLERQLWFINASLATLSMDADRAQWASYELSEPQSRATRERLVSQACAVGDRLCELALREGEDISWIGVSLVNEKHWTLMPLGIDLYNGLPGVLLFMAYLGSVTGLKRYAEVARETLRTVRRIVERVSRTNRSVGAFDGWGGWIYVLTHLSVLWDEPELLAEAEERVGFLPELIDGDEQLDVIGGAAGCLLGLLALYRRAPSERTLDAALKCGEHLLARAELMDQGIAWQTPIASSKPLAGFSHGAAGMAYALLQLGAVSGRESFRSAAFHAMVYERSIFSQRMGNWPDLRVIEGAAAKAAEQAEENFMMAWCHGAPGIGLARLASLRQMDDEPMREEIGVALRSTLAVGFGHNHSLCHGDLGNLELLLLAADTLGEEPWRGHLDRLASIVVESMDKHGWLCGIPLAVETPGLLTGLAGIGYGLLRLAEPQRVPSVLLLAPPEAR